MHDPQSIHIHTTRGHTRPAANISTPNPRACTTRSQYIYLQPAATHDPQPIYLPPPPAHPRPALNPYTPTPRPHDPQPIYLPPTRAHARPAVNTYTYNPRAPTTRSQYIYTHPARMHDPQSL